MGLSIARALSKKGIEVYLYEQSTIPNPKGSSCDDHRLIRYPYGNQSGYMLMVREAYAAWKSVWDDIGSIHYAQTGTLVTSQTGTGWAKDSLEALTEAAIPFNRLNESQLRARIPLLELKGVKLAYYLESGGVLFARRILASLKDYLLKKQVTIQELTKIRSIDSEHQRLHTESGDSFAFEHLIITAGPWTKDLIPGISVTPSQQTVYYLDVPEQDLPTWQQAPMLLDIDPGSGFYLVPPVAGLGLKLGDHRFTLQGHPDLPTQTRHPTPETRHADGHAHLTDSEAINLRYPIAYPKTCFYTVANNEEFLYKQEQNIHILTGFSGHGFKFGPVIGDRFAEVLTGGLEGAVFSKWLGGK